MRLSQKDFEVFQRATLEIHDASGDLETFNGCLAETLLKVIPTEMFSRFDFTPPSQMGTLQMVRCFDPHDCLNPALLDWMERLFPWHPFTEYFGRSGDPTALKMSDFYNLNEFRRTEIFEGYYRPLGVNRHLGLAVPGVGGTIIGLNLVGRGKDFTERDRLILNLLRPHLALANRNAERGTARLMSPGRAVADYELTPRETEIASWVVQGKSNPEIAIILNANVRTIEKHMERILEKLGVENRATAAVLLANGNGH